MRKAFALAAVAAALAAIAATGAMAAPNPTTGQPNQTCLVTAPLEPGQAANATGSAFNENGGTAGMMYAGEGASTNTPAPQNVAVSQYDVACLEFSNSHL